jgi:hypothetical protein
MLVSDPAERLSFAASIARQVYESEIPVQSLLRGTGMLAPELASVENEREGERYEIQGHLIDHLPTPEALQKFVQIAMRYGYWLATPEENAAAGVPVFQASLS